jgi:two-component system, sensor histidine kinase and response regulator
MTHMPVERPAPPVSGEELREEIAGEIVGALNAVMGFSQLLAADEGGLARELRERYRAHVREGAGSLRRLVLGVLGIDPATASKRGSGAHAIARLAAAGHGGEERHAHVSIAPTPSSPADRAVVVIVDADPRARELVVANLGGRGYALASFATSADALAFVSTTPPDLLFVAATDEGAFTAWRSLREKDAYLPIVFLTDVGDEHARARALDAGAEQILEKPIARHDLRARAKNLLNLRKNQLALAAQNEQLRRLQSFKDEMAALMVHDLKSPLSAIAMNLDVALGGLPEESGTDDVRGALEDCRVASARLFRMIANLLDIAKSEDGHLIARLAPVELKSLVAKIAQDHLTEAKLRNVHITWDTEIEGLFEVDADLLGRVVENLIENGLRYTRPGGHLRVIAKDLGTELEVRVANDGPAIPPDARAHIFEKYGQAATPGATRINRGLGLYFCRVAAEAHGGSILLGEEPGMTTCFSVRLPRKLFAH